MKTKIFSLSIFIQALFLSVNTASGQLPTYLIPADSAVVDGDYAPFNTIQPGDTVFIMAGTRSNLLIRDFFGTSDNPIIFINYGGTVTLNTEFNYGFAFANCRFIRFTGTGDPGTLYGFDIQHVGNGPGISLSEQSSDFEMDHVVVNNDPVSGLLSSPDPDCAFANTRGNFTQTNTWIHDNFIENTGNEGLYLGSPYFTGEIMHCNGRDTLLFPALLSGVKIYNNIITSAGWAGIGVSSASSDCQVYGNIITYDSQAGDSVKMGGVYLGPGSKCDVYNNTISEGKGDGIVDNGLGGNRIFNNLIVDAGRSYFPSDITKKRFGMNITDVSVQADSSFLILFNDIINPKNDGVRFNSVISRNNLVASNVIINPGDYPLEGQVSYVEIEDPASEVMISNNYFRLDTINAGFINGGYELKAGSPLIDAGYYDGEGISFDLLNHPRPVGPGYDIGAYEYSSGSVGIQNIVMGKNNSLSYPNPAHLQLTIAFEFPGNSDVRLDLYDLRGTRIYSDVKPSVPSGSQSFQVNVGSLSPGIYSYTLRSGVDVATGKFIKTN